MEPRPNLFADEFTYDRGALRGEPVARKSGAEQLGATLYELAPGADGIPLHVHHAMEEMVVVVSGRPTLRTVEGEHDAPAVRAAGSRRRPCQPSDAAVRPFGRQGRGTAAVGGSRGAPAR